MSDTGPIVYTDIWWVRHDGQGSLPMADGLKRWEVGAALQEALALAIDQGLTEAAGALRCEEYSRCTACEATCGVGASICDYCKEQR